MGPEILLLHNFRVSLHHDLTVLANICQVPTNWYTVTEASTVESMNMSTARYLQRVSALALGE